MKPQPGLALGGRYRLVRQIAVGGMGEVWVAKDESLARDIAIKVLKEEFVGNADFLNRFRVEARNAASLSHAHIAQLYDYGEQDGSAYLVMELVHGEPMSDVLEREPVLPVTKLLKILAQTSRALHAAHVGGVVHRDIKPGNIIIEHSGDVKITDFGVSLATNQVPMTAAGMVMGTAQYLSPEQAIGRPATGASDIYALGIVAYEAIAGNRPFTGKTPVDIAVAHVNEPVPPLPRATHKALSELVMRMLAKDPLERPRSAAALAHTFEQLGTEIAANPFDTGTRTTSAAPVSRALAPVKSATVEDPGPRITRSAGSSHTPQDQPQRAQPAASAMPAPQPRTRSEVRNPAAATRVPATPSRTAQGQPPVSTPHAGQPPTRSSNSQQSGVTGTPRTGTPSTPQRSANGTPANTRASSGQPNRATASPHAPHQSQRSGQRTEHSAPGRNANQQHATNRAATYQPPTTQRDPQNQGTRRQAPGTTPNNRATNQQGIVQRVKSLGWFTLMLIGIVVVVLLATATKAIFTSSGTEASASVLADQTSVEFTFAPFAGNEVGQNRGKLGVEPNAAQPIKDAQW